MRKIEVIPIFNAAPSMKSLFALSQTIFKFVALIAFLFQLGPKAHAFELPSSSSQCVVGIAEDWNSSHATLRFYQKSGNRWVADGAAWQSRLGKNGLIWGSGLNPVPAGVATKKEGDMRSPAGVFSLGGVWGYDSAINKHPKMFYRQVTPRDLWVEDAASPHYNRHLILEQSPSTPWEKKQQMKQNDAAHALKLFIAHNAPPKVVPNAGSSIFFHIWRANGGKPTAGCTTMSEAQLRGLIAKIDPTRRPLYVLLPRAEYESYRSRWKLP
jgi:L,D-peptidoglycan transpeptidase YkuD (ErfK/YbiS/YcfS/YnhG family)